MGGKLLIDVVSLNKEAGEFVLYLVEDGPWPHHDKDWSQTLQKIQTRIFDTIDTLLEGQVESKFPDNDQKKFRIQIDSPHGIPELLQKLIDDLRNYLKQKNEYNYSIEKTDRIHRLRISTGHEMGRFSTTHGIV